MLSSTLPKLDTSRKWILSSFNSAHFYTLSISGETLQLFRIKAQAEDAGPLPSAVEIVGKSETLRNIYGV